MGGHQPEKNAATHQHQPRQSRPEKQRKRGGSGAQRRIERHGAAARLICRHRKNDTGRIQKRRRRPANPLQPDSRPFRRPVGSSNRQRHLLHAFFRHPRRRPGRIARRVSERPTNRAGNRVPPPSRRYLPHPVRPHYPAHQRHALPAQSLAGAARYSRRQPAKLRHSGAGVGSPNAARAVGMAIGQNPVALLIPCHRVIRESGIIGGYRWQRGRKMAILAHELGDTDDA